MSNEQIPKNTLVGFCLSGSRDFVVSVIQGGDPTGLGFAFIAFVEIWPINRMKPSAFSYSSPMPTINN